MSTRPIIPLLSAIEDTNLLGVKLYPEQRNLVEAFQEKQHAIVSAGRRSGKTRTAAAVSLADLLYRPDLDALVEPGETRFAVCMATNVRQARIMIDAARRIVDASPAARSVLKSSTDDELSFELADGARVALAAFPCSSSGARGWPISTLVMDETAFHISSEDGKATAARVFAALSPSTAQFGNLGRILVVSSPMGTDGFFASQWKKADEGALPSWTAHKLTSKEMNPTLSDEWLAEREAENPETYSSEYLAAFESSYGDVFFDMARIPLDDSLEEAAPEEGERYIAGLDPGWRSDSFGVALLGRSFDGRRLVLGPVRAIRPSSAVRRSKDWEVTRDAQDQVTSEVVELCRPYNARAFTDQHEAPAFLARAGELGLNATVFGMTRARKYQAFKQLREVLVRGVLVLPAKNRALLDELAKVRLKLREGGPEIVLPSTSKGHLDMAQALAMAAWHQRFFGGEDHPRAGESMWAKANRQMPAVDQQRDQFGPLAREPLSMRNLKF